MTYAPGTVVRRHSNETAEQVTWIVDGAVTMTIGDETKELAADDVVVVNPGIEHELVSPGGVTFVEALARCCAITCRMQSGISCSGRRGPRST